MQTLRLNFSFFCLKHLGFILLLICIIGFSNTGNSQTENHKIKTAFSVNQSLSHTGFNLGLTSNWRYKVWELYLGPEMALSDSYYKNDPRLGYTVGLRYYSNISVKSSSFVFANYQRILYRPFLEDQYENKAFNTNTELTFGLGQEWRIYQNWHLGGSIGYGKYFDVFHDLADQKKVYFDDGTALLRFSITYKLK